MTNEKITAAMDLTAMMAVEQISERQHIPKNDALISFMKSNTGKMLYDDETKLWRDGPSSVTEEYLTECAKNA